MSCPTCGHTMQSVGHDAYPVFWCARCGSISLANPATPRSTDIPMLVERCREYQAIDQVMVDSWARNKWQELGIAESINLPKDRPQ